MFSEELEFPQVRLITFNEIMITRTIPCVACENTCGQLAGPASVWRYKLSISLRSPLPFIAIDIQNHLDIIKEEMIVNYFPLVAYLFIRRKDKDHLMPMRLGAFYYKQGVAY